MKGRIMNFRGGKHTKYDYQMIVELDGVDSRDKAGKMMKKKAIWTTPSGKKIEGVITNVHGNNGCVRVQFEKGMPGQAISQEVEVN